ncbi:8-amino-7-oxononanoate synthase [Thermanaerosceptrum fracticalcis]|uniref:8-amino-7-ketopelargonate synthase n=1 Tax=Thermanaerosceptrum fracticalcis TaxID=1712410 RepID=A0A7G6E0J8_THEFR|nr:8-amino-7-oxononanoate synthase [Thermanaerosceptrum fracticalcis]QNB45602.1 8-amino-7-oxononanoate synthase [Thermanaerosceptrum fracticalcis]
MERIVDRLTEIKKQGLYRDLKYLSAPQGPHTVIDGREVLLMASNSYLGLCNDERLKAAAIKALQEYGVGSGGSRLTTGSYRLHQELEQALACFKGTEAALVFNTGYMANIGAIAGLADKSWVIFSDELNHASIIDGCKLSGAKIVIYKHCDMEDLYQKVKEFQGCPSLIVTDGVFSMDGDIAPLDDIVRIAQQFDALTMVDDAHASGILGPNGGGTGELFGLKDKIDMQMGTLSKALASEGGYVAGKQCLIDYLRNRARSFIFTTALAPATVAVALAALEIVEQEPEPRKVLLENAQWLCTRLKEAGFKILENKTPIIPIIIGEAEKALQFSQALLEEGIYIPAIRPPTVPPGTSRLRLTLMATHTREDLNYALAKIIQVARELTIIKP